MIRKNFYLSDSQLKSLKLMNGITVSEHIRRAVDQYIDRELPKVASVSPSEKKGENK